MNKDFLRILGIALFAGFFVANTSVASAETNIQINGNSTSNNSVKVNQTNTNTIDQQNSANVTNKVGGTADTGGNKVNQNSGGEVKTGGADVKTNVCNSLNTNVVGNAGTINNPCITPASKPSASPETPGIGGPDNPSTSGGGGSSSSNGGGGVGGGSVMGLSATSGENNLLDLLKILPAFASFAVGYGLLRKNV